MQKVSMIWMVIFASAALLSLGDSAVVVTESVLIPDDFKDILSLIPKDLIKNITYDHLQNDDGFKSAVKFMQTDEWNNRVKIIREKPQWIAMKDYVKGFGINIDTFIKCVDGFLKNATVTFDSDQAPPKKSLKSFLIDVGKNLPIMNILSALHEGMIQNPKLQIMFEKLRSQNTRKIVDNVLAVPEVKLMMKDFADMDMNIEEVLSLLYSFLGWGELKIE